MRKRIKLICLSAIMITMMACSISLNLTDTPSVSEQGTTQPPAAVTTQPVEALPSVAATVTVQAEQTITVYFTNQDRFAVGTEPYEDAVTRTIPAGADPRRAVLDALFAGPTADEYAQGMRLFSSGFTHVRSFSVENGIARIYLGGTCANNGAAYSIASVIAKNLQQFPEITAYKIYDENDTTEDPDSAMSSIPYCLEP